MAFSHRRNLKRHIAAPPFHYLEQIAIISKGGIVSGDSPPAYFKTGANLIRIFGIFVIVE